MGKKAAVEKKDVVEKEKWSRTEIMLGVALMISFAGLFIQEISINEVSNNVDIINVTSNQQIQIINQIENTVNELKGEFEEIKAKNASFDKMIITCTNGTKPSITLTNDSIINECK